MKKKFFEDIKGLLLALFPLALMIALIAVVYFLAYQIAVSDLPSWFKFCLLWRR